MSAEAEMRAVLEHAAEKLDGRLSFSRFTWSSNESQAVIEGHVVAERRRDAVAMAYAEGVLHLLASYLAVDEAPRDLPALAIGGDA